MTYKNKSGITNATDYVVSDRHGYFFFGLKDYRKCDSVTKNENKTGVNQPTEDMRVDGLPCDRREFLKTLLKIRHGDKIRHDKMSVQNQRSKLGDPRTFVRTLKHRLHVQRFMRKIVDRFEENVEHQKLMLTDQLSPSYRRKIAIKIPSQLSCDDSCSPDATEKLECTCGPISETSDSIGDKTTTYPISKDSVISDRIQMENRQYSQERDVHTTRTVQNEDCSEEFDDVLDNIDDVRIKKDKTEGNISERTIEGTNAPFYSSPLKRTIVVTLPNPTLDVTQTFDISHNNVIPQRQFVGLCKTYPEMYNLKTFDDVKEDFEKRQVDGREKRNRVSESVDLKKQQIHYQGPRTLFTGTQAIDMKIHGDFSVDQGALQRDEMMKTRRKHELQQILVNNDKFSPSSIPTIRPNDSSTRVLSIIGISPGSDQVTNSLPDVAETVSYRSIPRKSKNIYAPRKRTISSHGFNTPSKHRSENYPRRISVHSQDDAPQSGHYELSKPR